MKKIIKICLSGLLLMLISGCDISYNLTIDKSLSVDEVVIGLEQNNVLEQNSTKEAKVQSALDTLNLMGDLGYYNKKALYNTDTSGVSVNLSFLSIKDYNEKSMIKDSIFQTFDVTEDKDTTTIKANAIYVSRPMGNNNLTVNTINLTVPYKVINHNADKVDLSTNTYTWNMSSNNRLKSVNITYANNANYVAPNIIQKTISSTGTITIIVVIIIALFGVSFIIINNKNNNKF